MEREHKYQGLSLLGAYLCTCGAKAATRERIDSHVKYYRALRYPPTEPSAGAWQNQRSRPLSENEKLANRLVDYSKPLDHTPGFATGGVTFTGPVLTQMVDDGSPWPRVEIKAAAENRSADREDRFDVVNKAEHYNVDPSGVECITIVRHRNFNIGNAIKYLWRAGLKDSPYGPGIGFMNTGGGPGTKPGKVQNSATNKQIEDLKKAIFYIKDEIKRLGGDPE